MRKTLIVLTALVVVGGPLYFWLFVESKLPETGSYSIDLAEVRRLAALLPGERASELRFEPVAVFEFPRAAVVAGDGWSMTELTVYSYQLVFPDRRVIIDTAMDAASAGSARHDAQAFARVSEALADAQLIVVTHEHFDHLAGLAMQPNAKALLAKAKLTKEQLAFPERMAPLVFPKAALEGYAPIEYDRYLAIAPGVVLIKAPGHTPGSQLVYVQRADGAEYLFLGDVAWHRRNVEVVRERPRLVTQLFIHEDRDAVMLELAELSHLSKAEPKLALVPGHDRPRVEELTAAGLLRRGFAER